MEVLKLARKGSIDIGVLTDPAFYILSSVIQENHGYLIMKSIEEMTNGQVIIGPASLYTTLKKLLEADLVSRIVSSDENKKIYQITPTGLEVLLRDIERKKQMVTFAEHFFKKG